MNRAQKIEVGELGGVVIIRFIAHDGSHITAEFLNAADLQSFAQEFANATTKAWGKKISQYDETAGAMVESLGERKH